jgi:hypothetical protein
MFLKNISVKSLFEQREPEYMYEGIYSAADYRGEGYFQLIPLDRQSMTFDWVLPQPIVDIRRTFPVFNQKLTLGTVIGDEVKDNFRWVNSLFGFGEEALKNLPINNVYLISDAANFPFNEATWGIYENGLVEMPHNVFPIQGKYNALSVTRQGRLEFRSVNFDDPFDVLKVYKGFSASKIMDDGRSVSLLETEPGTDHLLIEGLRGHPGQIFKEDDYSKPGSVERNKIHTKLLTWLRDGLRYREYLRAALNGDVIRWGDDFRCSLPRMVFNHTLWVEDGDDRLFLLKMLPKADRSAGLRHDDLGDFVRSVGEVYGYDFRAAYVTTNGQDVRTIVRRTEGLMPVRYALSDATVDFQAGFSANKYLQRPLASFIVVSGG